MGKITLIHLSGPRRGEVDTVDRLPASIGSDPSSGVAIPGVAGTHALLVERQEAVVLADGGSEQGTLLFGEPVREATLRDGDVIELGRGGPKLRFRCEHGPPVSLVKAVAWARPEAAPRGSADAAALFKAVVRETVARTSRSFRVSLVVVLALGAVAFLFGQWRAHGLRQEVRRLHEEMAASNRERRDLLARIEEERRRASQERLELEARIAEARAREAELNERLRDVQSAEAQSVRNDLTTTRQRLTALESERVAGERIIRDYGGGVALIQGSYGFYDKEGRGLRTALDEQGEARRNDDGGPVLGVDGTGPLYTTEYFGTGFLVDRRGRLLTNRHVAEPWWSDATADRLAREGFTPRFVVFRAFFPRVSEPLELETERVSDKLDLATVRLDLGKRPVPVLPLDRTGRGAVPGQPVVLLGYPAGLEALLAKADSAVVQQILSDGGTSLERVTQALSRRGLIRPSSTQGHIGDVTTTDIVFDAPTTQGGSGGPVLNKEGKVIAVEYAMLRQFSGSSFGVPIAYALELLRPPPRTRGD
ncbi:MAG TPA: trypsin-like peptidase domain-containing protein [Vicinamibacteria bacterium]|nr:trypsin-like peptidase domain-containing protein [Vicinamibacteria bacterium]